MNLVCQHECNEKAQKRNSVNASQATMEQPSRTIVHAKLEMTNPDSQEELEADAAANDIVQGGKIARSILAGSTDGGITVSSQMEGRLNSLQGSGQVMPDGLRNMMERGFNRDFSQVRLHTDNEAASLSSSIHAKAFTHGNDIYFNSGRYNPNTTEGQRLVAHELAHVAQGGYKIAREEDPIWRGLWESYPSNKKEDNLTSSQLVYSQLELDIANVFFLSAQRKNYDLNIIEDVELRKKVKEFIEKKGYKEMLLKLIAPYDKEANAYIKNIARTFLLYGPDFYIKKKRNLSSYVNGCAMRVSIALGRSGMTIKNLPISFLANGFEYFDAKKKFGVTDGPTKFKKALDKQFKKKGVKPIMVTLTTQDYNQQYYSFVKRIRGKIYEFLRKEETLKKKEEKFQKKEEKQIKSLEEKIKKLEDTQNNPDIKSGDMKKITAELKTQKKEKGKLDSEKKNLERSKGKLERSKGNLERSKGKLESSKGKLEEERKNIEEEREFLKKEEKVIINIMTKEVKRNEKKVVREFKGKTGIMVMITNNWNNAGGHVTLWNETKAADDLDVDYPNIDNMNQTFYLYELEHIEFEYIK